MLLPKKTHSVKHLSRPVARFLESQLQICVFALELCDARRVGLGWVAWCLELLESRFGLERAAPEGSELVTQVADEPLEVRKRGRHLRPFAV